MHGNCNEQNNKRPGDKFKKKTIILLCKQLIRKAKGWPEWQSCCGKRIIPANKRFFGHTRLLFLSFSPRLILVDRLRNFRTLSMSFRRPAGDTRPGWWKRKNIIHPSPRIERNAYHALQTFWISSDRTAW